MERSPNILFILLDDLGWADLGCYGSAFHETPRLDALAAEGMRFTDAYAACPVCSPTRASILTGRYPARVGVTQFIGGHTVGKLRDVPYFYCLPMSETTLATVLREEAGYQTWHVGKWHLGGRPTWPEAHGFDRNLGGCEWGQPNLGYFAPWGIPNLPEGRDGDYLTDRLTTEAIHLIESAGDRPFFLNLWHYAVHTPIQAPADLTAKYEAKARALGLDHAAALEQGDFFPCQHKRNQRIVRRKFQSDPAYAAMVENLDTNIGRLLGALDRAGHADNTVVIFTSDNGGLSTAEGSPTCNAPLAEGKGWMADGGIREPLLVRWPGRIKPGTICAEPVTSPDFFPTLLEAAGLAPRPRLHVDGTSFLSALRGRPFPRGPIFWHYPHYSNQGDTPAGAIRDGDWKLAEHFEDGRLELYNLRDDISETRDLAAAEPDRVRRMHAALAAWREEVGALMPPPNPNWRA